MFENVSNIKLLIKYYNFSSESKYNTYITNNELNPTSSNNIFINNHNQNHRYSFSSLMSNKKPNKTPKKINNKNDNYINELEQDYLIYFQNNYHYNNLENSFPPKIINIKTCIYLYLIEKKKFDITLDSLILFKYNKNKYQLLFDDEIFYPHNFFNKNYNNDEINDKNISNSTILYYYINNDKMKVIVDLYSKSVDGISLNISKMCSLYMLKYILLLKLKEIEKTKSISNIDLSQDVSLDIINKINPERNELITIEDIEKKYKIYGNGIMNSNLSDYLVKNQTNRNFNNNITLSQIYDYYLSSSDKILEYENNINKIKYDDNSSSKDNKEGILNFILIENKNNKVHIGLDFRFTILQYFNPLKGEEIKEEEKIEVINHDEFNQEKNGLNLYFNCLNNNCIYNQKIFAYNIGYGTFDIFNVIKHYTKCNFCYKNNYNLKNNISLKYIGMMNAKWCYKGYLSGIKMSIVEGKGITVINDLIYKTKEFNFSEQFKKLIFQTEEYYSKNNYIINNNDNINSILSDDLNSINDNNIEEIKYENIKENKQEDKNINIINEKKIIKENNDNKDNKDNIINNGKKKNDIIKLNKYHINNFEEINNGKNIHLNNIKTKQNLYRKHNSTKQAYFGNIKQYSPVIENFENNNTNIDFNIIIDKAKTNCCEGCFEYEQVSQVCTIF